MRLATLNTELEMWDGNRSGYFYVPAGTTVQVTESTSGWTGVRAPGGLTLEFPTNYCIRTYLDFLDEGSPDATGET